MTFDYDNNVVFMSGLYMETYFQKNNSKKPLKSEPEYEMDQLKKSNFCMKSFLTFYNLFQNIKQNGHNGLFFISGYNECKIPHSGIRWKRDIMQVQKIQMKSGMIFMVGFDNKTSPSKIHRNVYYQMTGIPTKHYWMIVRQIR